MTSFNITAELDVSPTERRRAFWEACLEEFADFHPAVGRSSRGLTEVVITVQAETMQQASRLGWAILLPTLGQIDRFEVLTTEEFDRRVADVEMPGLVGATEAADILGVTRQRIQQMATSGQIPSAKVGNALVFARSTVEQMAGLLA